MTSEEMLRKDIEALKADLLAIKTDIREFGRDVAAAARSGADSAKDRVRAAVDAAAAKGEDVGKKVQHAIEEKPVTSVLVAFGAGLLLGAILRK